MASDDPPGRWIDTGGRGEATVGWPSRLQASWRYAMNDFLRNNDEQERRRRLSMTAVVAGSVPGAGAALLLAPCTGRALRCKIAEGSSRVGKSVGNRASHLAHDAASL